MRINTNIAALNAQRNLRISGSQMQSSIEKLSSGLRINRAADDAAGLSISEKLRSQVRGLNQASSNAQDGISMIQTGEGALNEVHAILQRMNELGLQGANDTLSADDRKAVVDELSQLNNEINRIAQVTDFNGVKLLAGVTTTTVTTPASVGAVTASGATADAGAVTGTYSGAANANYVVKVATVDGSGKITGIQVSADNGSTYGGTLAVSGTNPVSIGNGLSIAFDGSGTNAANDTFSFAATAAVTTSTTSALQVSFQIGSGTTSAEHLEVNINGVSTTGMGAVSGGAANLDAAYNALAAANGATNDNFRALVDSVQQAIKDVSQVRSGLGAAQNRLERTIANLGVASENLSASESRIRDVDMSAEVVNMTKSQILAQAGTAILAQANQMPQSVLTLLR